MRALKPTSRTSQQITVLMFRGCCTLSALVQKFKNDARGSYSFTLFLLYVCCGISSAMVST